MSVAILLEFGDDDSFSVVGFSETADAVQEEIEIITSNSVLRDTVRRIRLKHKFISDPFV